MTSSPTPRSDADLARAHPLFFGESPTKSPGPSSLVNRPIWGQRKGSFIDYSAESQHTSATRRSVSRTHSHDAPASASSSNSTYKRSHVASNRSHDDYDYDDTDSEASTSTAANTLPRTGRVTSYDLQFDDADESLPPQDSLFGPSDLSTSRIFSRDHPPPFKQRQPRSLAGLGIVSPDQTPMPKSRTARSGSKPSQRQRSSSPSSAPRTPSPTSSLRHPNAVQNGKVHHLARQLEFPTEWLASLYNFSDPEVEAALAGPSHPKQSTPVKVSTSNRHNHTQHSHSHSQAVKLVKALSRALSDSRAQIDQIQATLAKERQQHQQMLEQASQESESREAALTNLCLEHGIKQGEISRSLLRAPVLDAQLLKKKRLAEQLHQQAKHRAGDIHPESGNQTSKALPQSLQEAMLDDLDTSQTAFSPSSKPASIYSGVSRRDRSPSLRSTRTTASSDANTHHSNAAASPRARSKSINDDDDAASTDRASTSTSGSELPNKKKSNKLFYGLGLPLMGRSKQEVKPQAASDETNSRPTQPLPSQSPDAATDAKGGRKASTRPLSMAQSNPSRAVSEDQSKRKSLLVLPTSPGSLSAGITAPKSKAASATTFARAFGRYTRPSPSRNASGAFTEPNVTVVPDTYRFDRGSLMGDESTLSASQSGLLGLPSPKPPSGPVELEPILPNDAAPPTMIRRRKKTRKSIPKIHSSEHQAASSFNKPDTGGPESSSTSVRTPGSTKAKTNPGLKTLDEESSGDEFEVYGGKAPVAGFAKSIGATTEGAKVTSGDPDKVGALQAQAASDDTSEPDSEVEEQVEMLTDRYGFIYSATHADVRLLRQARKASTPAPATLTGIKVGLSARGGVDSQSDDDDRNDSDEDNTCDSGNEDDGAAQKEEAEDLHDTSGSILDLTAEGAGLRRGSRPPAPPVTTAASRQLKSPLLKADATTGTDATSPLSTGGLSGAESYFSNGAESSNHSQTDGQGGPDKDKVGKKRQRRGAGALFSVSPSKPVQAEVLPVSASASSLPLSSPAKSGRTSPTKKKERKGESEKKGTKGSRSVQLHDSAAATALPSISNTVRRLLSQLKDMHDAQQLEQKQRWDAFLQRRREMHLSGSGLESNKKGGGGGDGAKSEAGKDGGGKLFGSVEKAPEEGWTSGLVGVSRMGDSKTGKVEWREFVSLCQSGIPICYRGRIWAECSGANDVAEPGRYSELLSEHQGEQNACLTQIDLDVYRTMPTNVYFGGVGPGVEKLRRVLVAFSWYNPGIGYCQGMNNLASILLLIYPKEEEAFWVLVCLIEKILPSQYYTTNLLVSQADQRVLVELVSEELPTLATHLDEIGVDLPAVCFGWFLSLFTDCLPVESLFRVWDVLFVEGMVTLFRVSIAILQLHEPELLATESSAEFYAAIHKATTKLFGVDKLIHLAEGELKKKIRYANILQKREKHVGDLTRELGINLDESEEDGESG